MQNARDIQNTKDTDRTGIDFSLTQFPYPPSLNKMYRVERNGFRRFLTTAAKKYKADCAIIAGMGKSGSVAIEGLVEVSIILRPPDRRRRDLDNTLKLLLDSLNGIYWDDDSQIARLTIERGEVMKQGAVFLQVTAYQPPG